jgi:hypothetical protein
MICCLWTINDGYWQAEALPHLALSDRQTQPDGDPKIRLNVTTNLRAHN